MRGALGRRGCWGYAAPAHPETGAGGINPARGTHPQPQEETTSQRSPPGTPPLRRHPQPVPGGRRAWALRAGARRGSGAARCYPSPIRGDPGTAVARGGGGGGCGGTSGNVVALQVRGGAGTTNTRVQRAGGKGRGAGTGRARPPVGRSCGGTCPIRAQVLFRKHRQGVKDPPSHCPRPSPGCGLWGTLLPPWLPPLIYDAHGCLDLFVSWGWISSSLRCAASQRVPNSCPLCSKQSSRKFSSPPPSLAAALESCLWGESGHQDQEGLEHGRELLPEGRASLAEEEPPENRAPELVPHLPGDDASSEGIFSPRLSPLPLSLRSPFQKQMQADRARLFC